MPTVPAESASFQVQDKEDELLDLPDAPSGDIKTSAEAMGKTKGFFVTLQS